ncbi:hypothetical protein RJT34_15989 [Clitoria ternatea]|uniref:alpha-L-fucosidase n=1 Tax=Clitoria ternatea TaxID=43366 RepID=A0AAN9J8E3_CLITE
MALFFHFGEWDSGDAHPSTFNKWIAVAKNSGLSRVMIITAKHHDGFCLWPSDYANYFVRSSPLNDRNDDVVALGVYTLQYNEFYLAPLTELLTRRVLSSWPSSLVKEVAHYSHCSAIVVGHWWLSCRSSSMKGSLALFCASSSSPCLNSAMTRRGRRYRH